MKYILVLLVAGMLGGCMTARHGCEGMSDTTAHMSCKMAESPRPAQPVAYAYNPLVDVMLLQNISNNMRAMRIEPPSSGYQVVPVPRSLSCHSVTMGQYVNTNCY